MPLIVPQYEVESVHKKMNSGRNTPFLVNCVDSSQNNVGFFILKSRSKLLASGGLQNELIASQLAKKLNLPTPNSAILNVSSDLTKVLTDTGFNEVGKSL